MLTIFNILIFYVRYIRIIELEPQSKVLAVINDIRDLARVWYISFCFVKRFKICAGYWLALRARLGFLFDDWIGSLLSRLISLLTLSS